MPKLPKYLVNLAGEYRTCSELNRRGVFATVTYGNRKGADVYAIRDQNSRALRIEVKTTQGGKFPNRIDFNNDPEKAAGPDFWVLFALGGDERPDRFFILSNAELCAVQRKRSGEYREKYRARHGTDYPGGFQAVHVRDVEKFDGAWKKIIKEIGGTDSE
jgi:hypothetical protein